MERKRIVIVQPKEPPKISTIPNTNGIIEHLLNGYADEYSLPLFQEHELEHIYLYCNEEGVLNNLPINLTFDTGITIRGTILILKKLPNGEISSLSTEEANKVLHILNTLKNSTL